MSLGHKAQVLSTLCGAVQKRDPVILKMCQSCVIMFKVGREEKEGKGEELRNLE
jgi:hypothetical protein